MPSKTFPGLISEVNTTESHTAGSAASLYIVVMLSNTILEGLDVDVADLEVSARLVRDADGVEVSAPIVLDTEQVDEDGDADIDRLIGTLAVLAADATAGTYSLIVYISDDFTAGAAATQEGFEPSQAVDSDTVKKAICTITFR